MPGHTRGPWTTYRPPNGQQWVVADTRSDGDTNCIATVWTPDGGDVGVERDANANLIAASPDLLAACRHAFRLLCENGNPFAGDDWELGHRLSAAIGKAEGKLLSPLTYTTSSRKTSMDRQQARTVIRLARRLTGMLQGTMGLEGMGLDRATLRKCFRLTLAELIANQGCPVRRPPERH